MGWVEGVRRHNAAEEKNEGRRGEIDSEIWRQ